MDTLTLGNRFRRLAGTAAALLAVIWTNAGLHAEAPPVVVAKPLESLVLEAESGEGAAQLKLAMRYDGSVSAEERDLTKAMYWYRRAGEKGYVEAQIALGLIHIRAKGADSNPAEAVRWFQKAAEQGHPVAQINLASCYANGAGVLRDMTKAARWFRESAERNQPEAQYYLGLLYGRGEGVPQSYVEAYKWVYAAAEQGVKPAKKSLETLESVMTPQDLAEAKKAVAVLRMGLANHQ